MGRYQPFTVEEHRELAAVLVEMDRRLTHITVLLANRGPQSSRRVGRARAAARAVSELRSLLDNELAASQRDEFDPSVYYPLQGDR